MVALQGLEARMAQAIVSLVSRELDMLQQAKEAVVDVATLSRAKSSHCIATLMQTSRLMIIRGNRVNSEVTHPLRTGQKYREARQSLPISSSVSPNKRSSE